MRKILVVVLLAGVLVLALSVPALAKPSDPPCAYGQYWKYLNWVAPITEEPVVNPGEYPPGQDIKAIRPLLPPGVTWGDIVAMSKQAASVWWAENHQ